MLTSPFPFNPSNSAAPTSSSSSRCCLCSSSSSPTSRCQRPKAGPLMRLPQASGRVEVARATRPRTSSTAWVLTRRCNLDPQRHRPPNLGGLFKTLCTDPRQEGVGGFWLRCPFSSLPQWYTGDRLTYYFFFFFSARNEFYFIF